ncbi:hypothetical protein HK098_007296 [Nowakowskiella sp. JEL0407]|nr:hypothetical protein HK098_007296 [Nowakowskiella sp. JEL0407]
MADAQSDPQQQNEFNTPPPPPPDTIQRSKPPSPPKFILKLSNYIIKESKPRTFVFSIVLYFLSTFILIYLESKFQSSHPFTNEQDPELLERLTLPDQKLKYKSTDLENIFQTYSPSGMFYYSLILVFEVFFIVSYVLMLACFASTAAFKFDENDEWSKLINLLPGIVGFMDLFENVVLGLCLYLFWNGGVVKEEWWEMLGDFAGKVTFYKWTMARLCGYLSLTTVVWNYGITVVKEFVEFGRLLIKGSDAQVLPSIKPGQKLPPGMIPTRLASAGPGGKGASGKSKKKNK